MVSHKQSWESMVVVVVGHVGQVLQGGWGKVTPPVNHAVGQGIDSGGNFPWLDWLPRGRP
ncbi:MAG TPA: hypothetical protein VIN09_01730 [Chloroflexota bacterium]